MSIKATVSSKNSGRFNTTIHQFSPFEANFGSSFVFDDDNIASVAVVEDGIDGHLFRNSRTTVLGYSDRKGGTIDGNELTNKWRQEFETVVLEFESIEPEGRGRGGRRV